MVKSTRKLELPAEMVAKGAEANIYSDQYLGEEVLVKKRVIKGYRIKEIDGHLRRKRTKNEAKLLGEAKRCGVVTPLIFDVDLNESALTMEKVKGTEVKELFSGENSLDLSEIKSISRIIGENVARLHDCGIIHGDFTTSNLILSEDRDFVGFIDFGLGKISHLVEDKGVDLLVFKKAINGIHHDISQECFDSIIKGYEGAQDYKQIVAKIEEIEGRGRYT
jgi:N6-L-threonylcarbamoyladenine synthase/protein kinase Bud32